MAGIKSRSDRHLQEWHRKLIRPQQHPAVMIHIQMLHESCCSEESPPRNPHSTEHQPECPPAFERSRSSVGIKRELGRKQSPWKQNSASPESKQGFAMPRHTSIQQSISFLKRLILHVPNELESRWEV